jgi:hypothetical protein
MAKQGSGGERAINSKGFYDFKDVTELPINDGMDDNSFDTDEDFEDETADTNQSEMNHVLENY